MSMSQRVLNPVPRARVTRDLFARHACLLYVVLSTTAAIAVVTAAVLYAHLKLVKWSLNVDAPGVRNNHVPPTHKIGRIAIVGILLFELGADAGGAIGDAIAWTITAIGGLL